MFVIVGLRKNLQNFASELGFKFWVMRGFRKGITLGGRTSLSFHLQGLQKGVAKNLQHFGILVRIQVFIFWVCKNGLQKNLQNFCI